MLNYKYYVYEKHHNSANEHSNKQYFSSSLCIILNAIPEIVSLLFL